MRSHRMEATPMEGSPQPATCLTSLEPLETNERHSRIGTASQLRLHHRFWKVRDRIISAFEGSSDEALLRRAERLDGCCAGPLIQEKTNGQATLILQCCRDRLCPRCQRGRGHESARRIASLVKGWNSCRFVTLTLRHRDGSLAAEIDRLSQAFRTLRKEPDWKTRVRQGVWSIEVTRNPQSKRWHAHLHLLYEGEFFPQQLLSKLWCEITEDSPIVDVRAVPDREQTARYIAEYVSKPLDAERWSSAEICEYASAMHGRRLIHTFGRAHGAKIDEPEKAESVEESEFVAPIRPLIAAASSGDADARHAIEILCRLGPTFAAAAGEAPSTAHVNLPPVEDWEHAIVLAQARRCFAALLERENPSTAAAASRPRPPRHQQQPLFDAPSYR